MVRRLAPVHHAVSAPGTLRGCSGGDISQRRGADCPREVTLSNLSHEVRTPLNIISGFTELLLDEVPGGINDEQRRHLADIRKACDRILEILDGYLDRASDGKKP